MPMLPPQKMPYDIPFKKYFNFSLSLIINFLEHIEVWRRLSWAWPPAELEVELCPRSFSLTLSKFFFQNVKLDLFLHRLMVQREENMTTKKMDNI